MTKEGLIWLGEYKQGKSKVVNYKGTIAREARAR
jgi:hypothetical protein